jgi:hypothetical protein
MEYPTSCRITPGYLTEMLSLQDALAEHLKRLKVHFFLGGEGETRVGYGNHFFLVGGLERLEHEIYDVPYIWNNNPN